MMISQLWFFSKVFIVSGLLAIAIKGVGPLLFIEATPTNALLGVLTLPVLLLLALLWRDQHHTTTSSNSR